MSSRQHKVNFKVVFAHLDSLRHQVEGLVDSTRNTRAAVDANYIDAVNVNRDLQATVLAFELGKLLAKKQVFNRQ